MEKATGKENPKQERAFETYYGLGAGRSYGSAARETGVSEATVKLWGRRYRWQHRVRERDLEVARTVADRSIHGEVETQDRRQKIVRMALMHVAKAIAEGKVKPTMSDLDRLIRLECFLSNEPDSRTEHVVGDLSGRTREELQAMLAREVKLVKQVALGLPRAPSSTPKKPAPRGPTKTQFRSGGVQEGA